MRADGTSDGEEVGKAPCFPAERDTRYLRPDTNLLSGATGAAILDDVALWNRALGDEIAALAARGDEVSPLAGLVPSRQIEAPERAIFQPGEQAASIPLLALLPELWGIYLVDGVFATARIHGSEQRLLARWLIRPAEPGRRSSPEVQFCCQDEERNE